MRNYEHSCFYANKDYPGTITEGIAFVGKLYTRIKGCDLQTFLYKS